MRVAFLISLSFIFTFVSCSRKKVIREFHLEPEPVRLDLILYSDSTFEETSEELEGTYHYSGYWTGSLEENDMFNLFLADSSAEKTVYYSHGSYQISGDQIKTCYGNQ